MNAVTPLHQIEIRSIDLNDRNECKRIDAMVHATVGGTPFHLPRWISAIETG